MPGKVKVKVLAGRNLPVMDKGSDTTDAYVEIKFGNVTHKTDVCRKSLNPQWNTSEWYRFEVDDAELQDEPLQLRLMDHDTYSANDAIGKVYISLNPLLLPDAQQNPPEALTTNHSGKGGVMSGWIPVFDTMHGIRGEVNVIVKVELFNDFNKFRQSSCGVQFFHSPIIPHGYQAQVIHGFVEELVINDDPEYQWIDKIRTPRASNEARQVAFLKLSGQVQRKIGLKALELGANAVIGFRRCLDLEGDVGVVARGIGTAVTLIKQQELPANHSAGGNMATSPDTLAQHLRKYIKFLNTEDTEHSNQSTVSNLTDDQITHILNVFSPNSPNIDPNAATKSKNDFSKHSSSLGTELFTTRSTEEWQRYKFLSEGSVLQGKSTISLKDDVMETMPLKNLLDEEDYRQTVTKSPISKSLKNLKSSSQGILKEFKERKLSPAKNKRYEDDDGADKMSMKSYTSEKSLKLQFYDLKDEIKKKARFKSPILKRSISGKEGGDIAAMLVRSVMHVHSSLDCIKELHENNSPMSTLRRPSKSTNKDHELIEKEQSTPNFSVVIDSPPNPKQDTSSDNVSFKSDGSVDKNLKQAALKIKRYTESCPSTPHEVSVPASFLKLPSEDTIYKSSTGGSSDEYSSSEDEDDNSEDNSIRGSASNFDTVSLIVKTVMEQKMTNEENIDDYVDESLNNESMENEPIHETDISKENQLDKSVTNSNQTTLSPTTSECLSAPVKNNPPEVQQTSEHKHHNIFDHAFKKVLKEKLHFKGFHRSHSEAISPGTAPTASLSPLSESKKSKFHFPTNLFRRHTSECEDISGGLLSPTTKKKRIRTFSDGADNLKSGLISTAIQTILMEKVNVMGEIISHNPIIGDEEHLGKNTLPCSLTSLRNLPDDFLINKSSVNTAKFNETLVDYPPLVLSKSLTDLQQMSRENSVKYKKQMDVLSLPRETVLGSLFMSIQDLERSEEERKRQFSISSGFSSHSSIHNYNQVKEERQYTASSEAILDCASVDIKVSDDIKPEESNLDIISQSSKVELPEEKDDDVTASKEPVEIQKATAINNRVPPSVAIDCNSPKHTRTESHGGRVLTNFNINSSHRRSSDSDLSITPKGNSLTAGVCGGSVLRPSMNQESIDMLEYPFLTITKFPQGFILHIGGAVAARSVKLLERVPNPEEPATRDTWWSELRTEVRSHMRALRCNAVLAYQETTAICDDVCVLSATGTAAVIDLHPNSLLTQTTHSGPPSASKNQNGVKGSDEVTLNPQTEPIQTSSLDRTDFEKTDHNNQFKPNIDSNARRRGGVGERCGPCHVPYNSNSMPYRVNVSKCALCKKGRVPSVVLCSLEPPEGIAIIGRGCLLQASISRPRTPCRGEPAARDISDQLPFLEYELHRLLLAKLRVRGMNAIFGLKTSIAVGGNLVAAVGVGTGVLLAALGPGREGPKVRAGPGDPQLLQTLQQGLDEALQANRNVYQLHTDQEINGKAQIPSESEESEDELPEMELGSGNKDTCVLEVDDAEDLEVLRVLTEARPPAGLHVVNTQSVPGLFGCEGLVSIKNLQMFTQLWRAKLPSSAGPLHQHFQRLLQNVYFKLRRMVPCAICDLRFRLDLPEADEIQLVVTGMAVGLGEPPEIKKVPENSSIIGVEGNNKIRSKEGVTNHSAGDLKRTDSNEMIFTLEEETVADLNGGGIQKSSNQGNQHQIQLNPLNGGIQFTNGKSAWQSGVDMTPLACVPGARILRYLGNLDYIFVRESTSIREHGGLSGFLHGFITEVMAVIRAHVTALGGNAIVAFYMTELILSDNPHKNQAQCLVSVGGDVVFVSYFPND